MIVHDITRVIAPDMVMWPGDPAPELEPRAALAYGDDYVLHTMRLSAHCGTHVDAPAHFVLDGRDVTGIPLDRCVGEADVITVPGSGPVSRAELAEHCPAPAARLLLRRPTGRPDPTALWLTEDAADWVIERGLVLVGFESPSVDDPASASYPVHRRLLAEGVVILESCDLRSAPSGRLLLVCAPLRWRGAEGSPVRALLIEL
ncbi:MAG: cyclase family protein [Armatimonadetes bacterium]|nr:cyclase family protein [Armatimonadota bacterium]